MRSNAPAVNAERTFEGGPARTPKPPQQLVRQVATCMLFEDTLKPSIDCIENFSFSVIFRRSPQCCSTQVLGF